MDGAQIHARPGSAKAGLNFLSKKRERFSSTKQSKGDRRQDDSQLKALNTSSTLWRHPLSPARWSIMRRRMSPSVRGRRKPRSGNDRGRKEEREVEEGQGLKNEAEEVQKEEEGERTNDHGPFGRTEVGKCVRGKTYAQTKKDEVGKRCDLPAPQSAEDSSHDSPPLSLRYAHHSRSGSHSAPVSWSRRNRDEIRLVRAGEVGAVLEPSLVALKVRHAPDPRINRQRGHVLDGSGGHRRTRRSRVIRQNALGRLREIAAGGSGVERAAAVGVAYRVEGRTRTGAMAREPRSGAYQRTNRRVQRMLVLAEGGVVGNVADGSIARRKSDDYQSVSSNPLAINLRRTSPMGGGEDAKESGMAGEARARRFKADNGRGVRHSVVKKETEDVGVEDNDKARVQRPGSNGVGELDGEEWGLSQRL
ncbi:hypothetical protein B0H14DRAFT_3745605 [Mycena olivaceomarginata]|nr:hypothetical protein B0H14DRAFT_3745605 [Mycena olivaceomarginata]